MELYKIPISNPKLNVENDVKSPKKPKVDATTTATTTDRNKSFLSIINTILKSKS